MEKTANKKGIKLPSYAGQSVDSAVQDLKEKGLQPVVVGSGKQVEAQLPLAGDEVIVRERIILKTNGTAMMPDLRGWSLRDAMKAAELLNLEPSIKGSGYVVTQSIRPGSGVKKGDYLILELTEPDKWEEQINESKTPQADQEEKAPVD